MYFESVYRVSDSPLHAAGMLNPDEFEFDLTIPIMKEENFIDDRIDELQLEETPSCSMSKRKREEDMKV